MTKTSEETRASLRNNFPEPEVLQLIPEAIARKYAVIPLSVEGNILRVAMANTADVFALEALASQSQMHIEPEVASAEEIQEAIDLNYRAYDEIERQISNISLPSVTVTKQTRLDTSIDAPIAQALTLIVDEAVKARASDIHLQPRENKLRVRFRIDGTLQDMLTLPVATATQLISRIKILANMNIADHHRPQDGQFSVKAKGRLIDIRVGSMTSLYGEMVAVDDVSFNVAEGEILGFLGPNGAGKTTTVKILTGQLKPKAGKAMLLGMDIAKNIEKVQGNIGVCFEMTNLYEQMSAIENLRLFARLFGIHPFDGAALLKRVGLAGREKDRVETYSKGMKQRLMVARSIVNQPRVLFLDEPTAGLDPTSSEAIRNIILEERQRGATVFLTTHDMMEADKLSDRVAFMNQGKIVVLDTPLNLKQQYGKRELKAKVSTPAGELEDREIVLDSPETPKAIHELFTREKVVTIHSEEATLEDIFISITGRGLQG